MRWVRRISGFALGALTTLAVLLWLGFFQTKDRSQLVLERFVTSCKPGQISERVIPNLAWLEALNDPLGSDAEWYWDHQAAVFVRPAEDRCVVELFEPALSKEQEAVLLAGFLDLGKAALPGSVYQDQSAQSNAVLLHVFQSSPRAPGAALMLVRFGHEMAPNDPLTLTYHYPKLGGRDA